jgi:hypothetical protein
LQVHLAAALALRQHCSGDGLPVRHIKISNIEGVRTSSLKNSNKKSRCRMGSFEHLQNVGDGNNVSNVQKLTAP